MTESKVVLFTILGDRDPRPYWDDNGPEGPIIKYLETVRDHHTLADVYPSEIHILFTNESAKKKSIGRADDLLD